MVNNYTIKTTYYDRKMDEKLLTQINERFPWIISYVKSHNCLDFQTGNDPKTNRSWFSIYRGTGRILTFRSHSGKVNEICDVAEAYKELMQPDFFRNPTPDQFDTYLDQGSQIHHTQVLFLQGVFHCTSFLIVQFSMFVGLRFPYSIHLLCLLF